MECELRSPRKGRHDIRIKSHVAEREDPWVAAYLQRALGQHESTPILLNLEALNQRTHPHSRNPDHTRSLNLAVRLVVFEGDAVFRHAHYARLGMNLDPGLVQSAFDESANFFAHPGHQTIRHFYYQHTRLAFEGSALHRVAQEVGHLGRKLDTAGASAHDGKRQRAAGVLWSSIRLHVI